MSLWESECGILWFQKEMASRFEPLISVVGAFGWGEGLSSKSLKEELCH